MKVANNNHKGFLLFLLVYHTAYSFLTYNYIINNRGDSLLYWWKVPLIKINPHWTLQNFGTKIVMAINYPFVEMGVPFFIGFLLYSCIGFLGIWLLYKSLKILSKDNQFINKYYIIELFLLLPNLHFWTAIIGKEPVIFLSLSASLYFFIQHKYIVTAFTILVVLAIRPHVGLMIFITALLYLTFAKKIPLYKKVRYYIVFTCIISTLLFLVIHTTNIKKFNLHRIIKFNDYSILRFQRADSYVPMLDYNWFYKYFSFLFRPFFYDSKTLFEIVLSIENLIQFIIFCVGLYCFFKVKNSLVKQFTTFFLLFTLVSCFFYVQRYACIGIFIRTKIMFLNYLNGFLLLIILQMINEKRKTY